MELRDALVPFKPKESATSLKGVAARSTLRVTALTNDLTLVSRLKRTLAVLGADITKVENVEQASDLIDLGLADATIIDIYGADGWPGLIFQLFDDKAPRHIVVILCGDAEDARHYRERSRHAFDIFPEDAIDDQRFCAVIQAALLRSEVVSTDDEQKDPSAA